MEYFLVKGTVHMREYLKEERVFDDIRLVKAEDPEDAQYKFEMFWERKSVDYSVSYYAYGLTLATIE